MLEYLPATETNPLLMLTAAKLLYFINRGHLDLAEELAERAFARTADFAAALPLLGQLRQARGHFTEAVILSIAASRWPRPTPFLLHMQVLKCIALLVLGDRIALDVATVFSPETPHCPPDIAVLIRLMFAPGDQPLPAALADALAAAGPAGARSAAALLRTCACQRDARTCSRM